MSISAGVLWILIPIFFALLLFLFNQSSRVSMAIGAVITTGIVLSILTLQVDYNYIIGATLIRLEPELSILGRSIVIEDADRIILLILYGISAVYLWVGLLLDSEPTYAPYSILISAMLASALFVETRLYFVLFVEIAILMCLPLLVKKDGKKEKGEHFLLIFVSISVPLLLLGGWAADSVAANPIDTAMINRTVAFLMIGFSMMIGVFPFFFWIPQIVEESKPVRSSYVLSILSFGFLFLLFSIGDAGGWLERNEQLLKWLETMGFVMITFGGVWAAFQNDLGRYFAFGIIIDNGFAFLAIKSAFEGTPELFYMVMVVRLFILFLFAITTTYLYNHNVDLTIEGVRGKFHRYPFVFAALFITILSFNALPLMANFTVRFGILQELIQINGNSSILWTLIGQLGFFLGALRFLGSAVDVPENTRWQQTETWSEALVFIVGVLVLLMIGLIPTQVMEWVTSIWSGFG